MSRNATQQRPAQSSEVSLETRVANVATMLNGKSMQEQFAKALPRHIAPEQFARSALTAVRRNPKLALCSQASFLLSLMTAAQCGLEVGVNGQCWILPFAGEATFVLGYRGLIQLCWRSDKIADIYAHAVYEGDHFEITLGDTKRLVHKPRLGEKDPSKIVAAYAAFSVNGGRTWDAMSIEEIEKIRGRSPAVRAGQKTPWDTDYEEMAKKTVLKRLLKWAPLSREMSLAIAEDDASELGHAIDADFTTQGSVEPASLDEVLGAGTRAESQGSAPCPECKQSPCARECSLQGTQPPA